MSNTQKQPQHNLHRYNMVHFSSSLRHTLHAILRLKTQIQLTSPCLL